MSPVLKESHIAASGHSGTLMGVLRDAEAFLVRRELQRDHMETAQSGLEARPLGYQRKGILACLEILQCLYGNRPKDGTKMC